MRCTQRRFMRKPSALILTLLLTILLQQVIICFIMIARLEESCEPEILETKRSCELTIVALPADVDEWYFETFYAPRVKKQFTLDHITEISPTQVCRGSEKPFLLFLVANHPKNREHRDSIRRTWGSVTKSRKWPTAEEHITERIDVLFLLGNSHDEKLNLLVLDEAEEHGDMLQLDYVEAYWNLTRKFLTGYQWMARNCENARYVVKVDDDSFVNFPMLISHLQTTYIGHRILGFVSEETPVDRCSRHKVTMSAYPFAQYPRYCTGNMYLMETSAAKSLLSVAEYMPLVNIEDAYITGILAKVVGLGHMAVRNDVYDWRNAPGVCDFANNRKLFGQQVFPKLAEDIWSTLRDTHICSKTLDD